MLRNKNIKFNKEKFKTLMHYIIYKCGHKENVGKTVLYKLLYFTDFNYYELHETMITGESYIKWTRGPAPRDFEESKNELISEGKIVEIENTFYNHSQIKYLSLKKPDDNVFNEQELNCINKTIKKLSNKNASEMTAYSHEDMPWMVAEDNEELEPEFVFYRDPEYCVGNYD